ncbi:MAG: shikimate dehydrogenase [Dehalococcoidia bacterium]
MKRAGVIGHPLGHSISPAIFQSAFDAAKLDVTYEAWDTTPDQLEARIASLRADDVLGANVTVPHKEAVIPLLDKLDERAEHVGAVNTIANENGQLVGYNTDMAGFMRALREDAHFDPKRKRIGVLGAGGAARAVSLALIEAGANVVLLAGRTPRRLDAIVAGFRQFTKAGTTITWCHWLDGTFMTELPRAEMLVNCTPVGTKGGETEGQNPMVEEYYPTNGIAFDLVYNPPETPFLKAAKANGTTPVSGLGMLVYQAAESFRIWTGQDAPVDKMLAAARAQLS